MDVRSPPKYGTIELTYRCNFGCRQCYNPQKAARSAPEMSTEEWIDLIDEFGDIGVKYITVTGGEVFVRKDFLRIYEHLIFRGIKVNIETNASTIAEDVLSLLQRYPPVRIDVSIYGFSQEDFEEFTDRKMPHDRVLTNVVALKSVDTDIRVRAPLTKLNFKSLPQLRNFAQRHGLAWDFDEKIWWSQDGVRRAHLRCTAAEVKPLVETDPVFQSLYDRLVRRESGPVPPTSCNWGTEAFFINPYGELFYCNVFWGTKISVRDTGLAHAWNHWYPKMRRTEGNYCVAKQICGTGGDCPAGVFYHDVEQEMTQTVADRYRAFLADVGEVAGPGLAGVSQENSHWLTEQR